MNLQRWYGTIPSTYGLGNCAKVMIKFLDINSNCTKKKLVSDVKHFIMRVVISDLFWNVLSYRWHISNCVTAGVKETTLNINFVADLLVMISRWLENCLKICWMRKETINLLMVLK